MFPRSFKKLALCSVAVLLVVWLIVFATHLPAQQFSLDDNSDVKSVEEFGRQRQRVVNPRRQVNTELKLKESVSVTPKHSQQSKVDSLQVPMLNNRGDFQNLKSKAAQDLMSRIKVRCRDNICSEFVTKADKPHFDYCIKKTWKARSLYREPQDSVCRFIDGTGRHPIALASFPGSGNTWVRGLIQGVTGLCTGAIYCDRTLRVTGFPGESIRSGIVLVVKTHHYEPRWAGIHYDRSAPFSYFKKVEHIPVYSSAVFILRNPFDSLVSEYSRQLREEHTDSHVNLPKPQYFGTNIEWNDFVQEQVFVWERTVLAWVSDNHNHPVLVVKYEDLTNNTVAELRKMLDFLQVPYSLSRLQYVVGRGYSMYKRKHDEEFDHYTVDQRDTVRSAIERVARTLEEHNLLGKANVSSYLTS